jgi:hypothetical protein
VADEKGQSTTLLEQASVSRESALRRFWELFGEDGLKPDLIESKVEVSTVGEKLDPLELFR